MFEADEWTAIDDVPAEALAASQLALCRLPHKSLVEPWAAAYADVLARFLAEREHGEERRDRRSSRRAPFFNINPAWTKTR